MYTSLGVVAECNVGSNTCEIHAQVNGPHYRFSVWSADGKLVHASKNFTSEREAVRAARTFAQNVQGRPVFRACDVRDAIRAAADALGIGTDAIRPELLTSENHHTVAFRLSIQE